MARGSIRPKNSGYEVRVYAGKDPLTGRDRYISRMVHGTRRDAEATVARLLVDVADGRQRATDGTLAYLLERWYEISAPRMSPKTAEEARRVIDQRINPRLGDVRLARLDVAQLDRFYLELERSGSVRGGPLGPASVRNSHTVLRAALATAVRWGWLDRNPAAFARVPAAPRPNPHPPTPHELRSLLAAAAGTDLGVFIRVSAVTGARRGEVCALRWDDLDGNELLIRRALVVVKGGVQVKTTKTGVERRLALDPDTVAALRDHRRRAAESALAAGAGLLPHGYVFAADARGARPWNPAGTSARFRRLTAPIGLDHVELRQLRHFVATNLGAAGVPVRAISGRLGHARTSTTTDIYSAWLPATDAAAAKVLGNLLTTASDG